MICYTAFQSAAFQRANLVFIKSGLKADGLLELTYPARNTPAIPFFSCIYPIQIAEYIRHTGDTTVLSEVYDTARTILQTFFSRIEPNGLIADFEKPYWNFYEWSVGSDGVADPGKKRYDLILNCAVIAAAKAFNGYAAPEDVFQTADLADAVRKTFYNRETGLFISSTENGIYTEMGNAFAVLAGIMGEKSESALLGNENCVEATLSVRGFVYDALLLLSEKNKDFILNDIRSKYKAMLDNGATTFWETLEGEAAFDHAGSLCHGWSALPVHYLTKLNS